MSQVPHSLVARGAVRTDSTSGVRGPAEADPGAGRRRAFATAATFVCAAVGALAVGRPWVRITGRMGPWGNMMDPAPR